MRSVLLDSLVKLSWRHRSRAIDMLQLHQVEQHCSRFPGVGSLACQANQLLLLPMPFSVTLGYRSIVSKAVIAADGNVGGRKMFSTIHNRSDPLRRLTLEGVAGKR